MWMKLGHATLRPSSPSDGHDRTRGAAVRPPAIVVIERSSTRCSCPYRAGKGRGHNVSYQLIEGEDGAR